MTGLDCLETKRPKTQENTTTEIKLNWNHSSVN